MGLKVVAGVNRVQLTNMLRLTHLNQKVVTPIQPLAGVIVLITLVWDK